MGGSTPDEPYYRIRMMLPKDHLDGEVDGKVNDWGMFRARVPRSRRRRRRVRRGSGGAGGVAGVGGMRGNSGGGGNAAEMKRVKDLAMQKTMRDLEALLPPMDCVERGDSDSDDSSSKDYVSSVGGTSIVSSNGGALNFDVSFKGRATSVDGDNWIPSFSTRGASSSRGKAPRLPSSPAASPGGSMPFYSSIQEEHPGE